MKTYQAAVSRDGKWWMIAVPEVDGVTQARRLADVEQMARELIAVTLGTKISEVAVEIEYQDIAGTAVNHDLALIRREKAEAARLEQDAARRTSDLVRALVAEGIPLRDIGQMLGVSFQRVHQLAS
jgi:hypothetical protein